MGDKVITDPLISLSVNFAIYSHGDTLYREEQSAPLADMVYFKVYSMPQTLLISRAALHVLNKNTSRRKFEENFNGSSDITEAYIDITRQDRSKELQNKSVEQVVWGPAHFCRLTTTSGNNIYIPADFKTLRNALLLGLDGAHIDIDINEKNLSSTIRTYKPRQSTPKRTFRMQ